MDKGAVSDKNMTQEIVYKIPGMENVIIKKDLEYLPGPKTPLNLDIYYPPEFTFQTHLPAVLVIYGFNSTTAQKIVGCRFKDWSWYISWGKLIAASGMAAIMYETHSPEKNLNSLLQFLQDHASELSIDKKRIGIYSCSANVPTALVNCMDKTKTYFCCAVFYYGFFLMTDQDYIQEIDSLSQKMGFSTPKLNSDLKLRRDLPLFIVRAGLDDLPYLNKSIDHFISKAVHQNLPLVFINYPEGHHGFDAYDDNNQSREIIKKTVGFWKSHLFKQES